MSKTLSFYKASDGTAATGMNVSVIGSWVPCKIGQPVSFQMLNPTGPAGTWSLQGTNEDPAVFNSSASAVSTSLYWGAPAQPAGTAGSTSITVQATHENMRPYYTPATGGTGVVPTGFYGLGAGGVVVIPPDVAMAPASNAAAVNALVADAAALGALADDATALGALADDATALGNLADDAATLGVVADAVTVAAGEVTVLDFDGEALVKADVAALNGRGAALGVATLDAAGKLAEGLPSGIAIASPIITGGSLQGETDSPTREAALTAYANDAPGWARTQARRIAALDTGGLLTGFRVIDVEQIVLAAPTGVTAAGVQGGGGTFAGGSHGDGFVWLSGGPVIANPRTNPFAVAWRAAYQTPESADTYRLGLVGLVEAAGTGAIGGPLLGEYYTYGDHTNMIIKLVVNAAGALVTSMPVDNGVLHDWLIFSNGTTMTFYCDGVAIYTLTDLSGVGTNPCYLTARGNLGHVAKITDMCFAFART